MRPNEFLIEPVPKLRRPLRSVYFESFMPKEAEGRVAHGHEIAPNLRWYCANEKAELFYGHYDGQWEFELDRPAGDFLSFVLEIDEERRKYFQDDLIFAAGFHDLSPVQFAGNVNIDGELSSSYLGKTFSSSTSQEKREWTQLRFAIKNESFDCKDADRVWLKIVLWPMDVTSFSFADFAIWLQRRAYI